MSWSIWCHNCVCILRNYFTALSISKWFQCTLHCTQFKLYNPWSTTYSGISQRDRPTKMVLNQRWSLMRGEIKVRRDENTHICTFLRTFLVFVKGVHSTLVICFLFIQRPKYNCTGKKIPDGSPYLILSRMQPMWSNMFSLIQSHAKIQL